MGLSIPRWLFIIAVLPGLFWTGPVWSQTDEAADDDFVELKPIRPPDHYYGLLTESRRLRGAGSYKAAFTKLSEILSDGQDIETYYQEAQYEIALTLFDMGLFQSALTFFERIADEGAVHVRHRDALQWLVRLHRKIPGNMAVLEKIASYPPSVYPDALLDEIHFLIGLFHYSEADLEQALGQFRQVRKKGRSYYIKARYLSGVIHVELKQAREAEQSFKDVLRYFAASGSPDEDSRRFRDLSTLALARMFFTVGNHRAAERFYKRIPKTSEYWLDAVYELSWTYFHMGDYARSMGNLWTLDSPYFEYEYFPEAKLLQATILFATCNDRMAIKLVNGFVPEFQGLQREVKSILGRATDAEEFYFYLAKLAATSSNKLSLEIRKLFNGALSSRRIQRYFSFIIQLNKEVAGVLELQKKLGKNDVLTQLEQDLVDFRVLMIAEAGDLSRSRLVRVRKDVSAMLTDSLRLKFETIRRIRRKIGKKKPGMKVASAKSAVKVDDEHVLYNFDGEYWMDELGTYLYEVRDLCPAK
ncbi:MAG: hypothetical protein CMH54_05715 [Myxococcales bacterium]|mgnify:CR=1 FL=1|nr:hypothetical protein [Myxococcales bacterium]|tara:strand:- start:375 stop:1961 length:1587 start_codon:yes stop_codon:yes gene_type:complete